MSFDYFLCDCVSNRIVFEKSKLVETKKKKIHTIIFHILSTTLCFLSVSLSIIFVILSHTLLSLHTNYTNMIFVWKSVHCHARHLEIIKGGLLESSSSFHIQIWILFIYFSYNFLWLIVVFIFVFFFWLGNAIENLRNGVGICDLVSHEC